MSAVGAIILAAGRGQRMGADKALLALGDATAIERVVRNCREGGAEYVVIVRAEDATPLPASIEATIVRVPIGGEMLDSVRAGVAAVPDSCRAALVFPVDYAMVDAASVRAIVVALGAGSTVALPLFDGRPGHPIGLSRTVFDEVLSATAGSLRDIVAADSGRVRVVEVADPWILRDLDGPEDLAAARAAL